MQSSQHAGWLLNEFFINSKKASLPSLVALYQNDLRKRVRTALDKNLFKKWFSIALWTTKFSQLVRKLCNLKLDTYFHFQFLCVEMTGAGLDQATKIKRARPISTRNKEPQLKFVNTPTSPRAHPTPNSIPRNHARIPHLIPYREITRALHT